MPAETVSCAGCDAAIDVRQANRLDGHDLCDGCYDDETAAIGWDDPADIGPDPLDYE